jgi:RimJ/RimL family protein N-acetyltransferase
MSSGMPVVQTDRLVLRRLVPDDAAFMLGLLNDPDWIRFIGDRGVRSVDAAREYLVSGPIAMYEREGYGLFRVEQKADGVPVGVCGLIKRPELADVDLGFAFMPQFRGLGYGAESAGAALRYGLKVLGLRRIVAITSPDNADSMRLLQRTGLRFERRAVLFEGEDEVNLFAIGADAPA